MRTSNVESCRAGRASDICMGYGTTIVYAIFRNYCVSLSCRIIKLILLDLT